MYSFALTIKIDPAYRIAYLEATKQHIKNSRNEEGCVLFDIKESEENPNTFLYIEAFKTREDYEFHSNQYYLVEYREKIKHMTVGSMEDAISRYPDTNLFDFD
ncbi:MAG: putative quinol monooxygenase [Candidatus Kariarchaeaceae archaeon]|jgi:quinol monooxygenase YgiN